LDLGVFDDCPFFPFGKDDHLHIGIGKAVIEHAGKFLHFRAIFAVAVFDDGGRVADHPHHAEEDHEEILFLLC